MDDKIIYRDTLRKRKNRKEKTSSLYEARVTKQREKTCEKKVTETTEEQETRLSRDRERKCKKLATETDKQHEEHLKHCQMNP
ncbi:101_t:CDS:2 [Acaulospora morrowiae]|uniref:101_t:CDS:1 n=1 Tax=Acaulospora morrowiae TaxID=94023 RepID=A0A9N9AX61_9GLOM|nr:101_t:CDS:2 [Acaulospora morrowiae]